MMNPETFMKRNFFPRPLRWLMRIGSIMQAVYYSAKIVMLAITTWGS